MNLRLVILIGFAITMTLAGCSAKPQVDFGPTTIESVAPSAACNAAGVAALAAVNAMHDREDAFYETVDADGVESDAELAEAVKVEAQADIDFGNAIEPTFSACTTAGEWLGLLRETPAIVESTTSEAITDTTLQDYCGRYMATPVCLNAAQLGIPDSTAKP